MARDTATPEHAHYPTPKLNRIDIVLEIVNNRSCMKLLLPVLLATTVAQAESRIKIAVIDTGISHKQSLLGYMCKSGVVNMTDSVYKSDFNGHGSHIAHIIGSRIDSSKYCITSFKVWHDSNNSSVTYTIKALEQINRDKSFKYVNISMSGDDSDPHERRLLKSITSRGTYVNVAAGNNTQVLGNNAATCNIYPACYKHELNSYFNVVEAPDTMQSNRGSFTVKENGRNIASWGGYKTGTSQACAMFTARLITSHNNKPTRLINTIKYTTKE